MSTPAATADAVLDFLRASATLGVYEPQEAPAVQAGESIETHVIAEFDLGRAGLDRVGGRARSKVWRVLLRCVGATAHEARFAAGEIYGVLDGGAQVPVPDTRSRTQVRVESSTTVELDDPDVPDVYSGLIVITFASSPDA